MFVEKHFVLTERNPCRRPNFNHRLVISRLGKVIKTHAYINSPPLEYQPSMFPVISIVQPSGLIH
jgi:hypothetical protein